MRRFGIARARHVEKVETAFMHAWILATVLPALTNSEEGE